MILTEDMVLAAMDPNGATMKYGAIVAQLESNTGHSGHELYRWTDRILQAMKRDGRVELVKGYRGGWRKAKQP